MRLITQSRGLLCQCLVVSMLLFTAGVRADEPIAPDLTARGERPEASVHDWNLGTTGARGWMFSHRKRTSLARQILITEVAEGSPADGVLKVGDVILGVFGKPFEDDPRMLFGKALTLAETKKQGGKLSLIRWRDGQTQDVTLLLAVLGSYSPTAPFNCEKSDKLIAQGCAAIAREINSPNYRANPMVRSLNALALLASGDEQYLPLMKQESLWAKEFVGGGKATWWYGPVMIFLSEYIIATDDTSVLPGLERMVKLAVEGQSIVGSWGHRFANEQGRLYGYGMMNAPGVPMTTALVLARKAGAKHPELDQAIQRSTDLLRFYVGKGCIPYGDHRPNMSLHDDNGKNGAAAILFNLLGDEEAATYFSWMSIATHGDPRNEGHTGNFFNMLWALPAVALSGPEASGAWMQEFGTYYFDLARQLDGSFVHLGPPQERRDSYYSWDATGAYVFALAIPRGNLAITDPLHACPPQLDREAAESLIDDGRGWDGIDATAFYDAMTNEQLIQRLSNWSPIVRDQAAQALGRRKADVLDQMIGLLNSESLYTRLGACAAIEHLRGDRSRAVPKLIEMFETSDELWLRIQVADALARIGEPARRAVPTLLARMALKPDPKLDPRGMEQRYLSFAVFAQRDGLLGRSLEGVERDALMRAVRTGLQNQDGRARGSYGSVYSNLTLDELRPLMPVIRQAILEDAPSGIMFQSNIRMAGLKLYARHHIEEGLDLMLYYLKHQKPHGSSTRLKQVLKMIESYGVHAQRIIPELEAQATDYDDGEEAYPIKGSRLKAMKVRELIDRLREATDGPELISVSGEKPTSD